MSKRSVRSIAAIVSLLFAASQASAAICVPCPGCSPAQMLQAAIDKRQGVRLVWNPTDGSIREYRVTCGIEPNEATTRCAGIEGEAPQMMHDIAATLLRLSNATGGTYKATAEIRANRWSIRTQPNPSARDYVADANYRAQLLDRIEQDGLASVPGVAGEVMP
ncbi:MAG: hypothetical protein ACTHK2_17255 [Dokdonella sp.]|uniref:hypothetical protein n=1 Tax=Dokdonella sp. TaxID=2291710 RepID=UPI003F7EA43D